VHALPTQLTCAIWHEAPQQLGVVHSQPSSVAQPVGWLQFECPEMHVELHTPPLHDRVPTLSDEHERPQQPQLFTSVASFTQTPLQHESPPGQVLHAPPPVPHCPDVCDP
jgi:hypothetical protein